MPIVGTLQSVDDRFWGRNESGKIVPDDGIQLVCWDVSRPASFVVPGVEGLRQAAAGIIASRTQSVALDIVWPGAAIKRCAPHPGRSGP